MNKLFTKIVGVALGLTMAIGVGVAVGSNVKEASPVHATSGDELTFDANSSLSDDFDTAWAYAFTKGSNGNEPAAYSDGIRVYNAKGTNKYGGHLTISPKSGNDSGYITSVVITAYSASYTPTVKVKAGDTASSMSSATETSLTASTTTYTYTITGTSTRYIEFTNWGNNSNSYVQWRVNKLKINYTIPSGGGGGTTYAVTYNANGATSGTVPTDATAYSSGATVTVKGNTGSLAKTDYDFGGWNTQADGLGTNYAAGSGTFSISANTTLYAKWDAQSSGGSDDLSFSFTSQPSGWPTASSAGSYTYSGYTFVLGANVYYNSSHYLMMKSTTSLGLPAISGKKLTKVVATNSSGCSTKTYVGVSSSNSSESYVSGGAKQIWSTTSSDYTYNLSGTAVNTMYYLYITAANAQMTNLSLTYEENTPSKTLSSITVSEDHRSFTVGDTFVKETVTATYSDSSTANVTSSTTFSGYNMSTAGSQTVTASYTEGGVTKTATYGITVSAPTTPFITPAKNSTSGYTGQNESLSFTYGNLTGSLSVTSSNTSVVTVETPSYSAGSGTVQINFVGAGSTTVKFNDGSNELASVLVSVTASSVTITGLAAEATCYSNSTLDLGATITVTATGSYSNAVTWESDDASIATVNPSTGVVTPVALGTANITVTSDDYPSATMTCEVTVATAPQKYVIDGPDNDSASNALTLANLKTYYPTTNMEVEWTAVDGSIFGSSTQAMRVGTGSATGSATLSLVNNASIYVTKIVVNVKNYGSDSATFVVNGNVTTNTTTSATGTATDYEFNFSSTDTSFTIQNVSKRIYVYRVDVYYSYKAAELSASPSSFDLAVSTPQAVALTPANFTPSSYTAAVKSGTSLTANSVDFSGNIATVTAGVSTGVTVLTITGTEGLRTASVDITVNVTQPRNLTALTITTASDATTFKVGQTFDVGSLVITATFDSAPTTVVYSKAQGNMALLTALPEIGYEFIETDIGTVTSAEFELTVGTGTKSVSYTISVVDKDYAGVATNIGDLWDGQKVYFSNGTNAAFPKYSAGKNVTSVEATIDGTKGLDIGSTSAFAYTVGRVKIESTVYYTFSFDDGGDTYYIKDAGTSSDNAINKTTDTTDTTIYWTISAGTNSGQWHIVNRSNTNKPTLQVNGSYLSCYGNNQTDPYLYVVTPYSEEAVADAFTERYLHMDESVVGQCNTYYPILKPVWAAMGEFEKAALSGAPYERLQAWAAAHGEHLDSDRNIVANARINILGNVVQNGNTVAIIVVISMISVTCIGGYFFLRKRKEN